MFPSLVAFLKSAAMQPSMRKCITDFRIGWKRSSGKEEKRLRKKWKKPENFSGFFLLLGKQNQVFIGSYSVEAKRRLKSTCWRSKQEQISDRRPVFFRLKKRFSVFVICFLACLCNEKLFGFIAAFRYVVDLKNDDRLAT